MKAISIESQPDRFLISIDKRVMDKDALIRLVERLRLEFLASQVDFDEDMMHLGEEIKQEWWGKNKEKYIGFN